MFTGIIEEKGKIESIKSGRDSAVLTISADKIMDDVKTGDSIAVNGVCLTVISITAKGFTADVMHETLDRSSLRILRAGSYVNLERAMPVCGRFGGHIVAGHIDGTGKITGIKKDGNAVWYTVHTEDNILRYIVEKGSVAIDGISLTVAKISGKDFSVSIIPHTLKETALNEKKVGDIVNLENDVIGKYVEKLILNRNKDDKKESKITIDMLYKYGF